MEEYATRHSISYELERIPVPLAEHLDQRLAMAALRKYEMRRTPHGMLRSAWNYVEYGLNAEHIRDEDREEYIHTGQLLTSMVIAHPKVHQDTVLSALTLSTYIPLFHKRGIDKEIVHQDCEAVYQSLGQAMQYLRPLAVDEPPQWRMTEIGVLALSARSRQPKLLLYPTSPREETSGIQSLNHDSYFYNDKSKIPIQQKLLPTQKIYDAYIQMLIVQPLIDKALKKTGSVGEGTLSDKVNYLLSLIIAEVSGAELSRSESLFLNVMTESVVSHYFEACGENEMLVA